MPNIIHEDRYTIAKLIELIETIYQFRQVKCKHIFAVELSKSLREATKRITQIENVGECVYCHSSEVGKDGVRHNKHGDLQIYHCQKCQKHYP